MLGDAAFVERGADGVDEGVDVFLEEELAVAEDSAGIVDKSDEPGLFARTLGSVGVGPEHGVGLPELVGEFHAEGEPFFVGIVLRAEQFVFADESVEGGLGDLVGS